ncbi:uncharacterized protein LOC133788925 [Humulus lupulus]|uniref:uncharacterized protein LOC133788925 n=1 Tax=Humulus lupulus TaxID=3486 RepID=UPI002B40521F|nr:uncharacterized protein LOC133788925 [Humulus lupulus]
MALPQSISVLFLVLVLARIEISTCQVFKAKVSCLDCTPNPKTDLSGIKVLVKCDKVKKMAMATTENDGSFEAEVPTDNKTPQRPLNCLAKLLGGPNQLYASSKTMVSQIVQTHSNSFTISTPLSFYNSCPSTIAHAKCEANKKWDSSKTIDLPLPPQWGLAPSSYYIPFFPIIGIP